MKGEKKQDKMENDSIDAENKIKTINNSKICKCKNCACDKNKIKSKLK